VGYAIAAAATSSGFKEGYSCVCASPCEQMAGVQPVKHESQVR
jgi:hypothetical protein